MHKITAYLLLCVGLLIIFFALVSAYHVFVAHQTPVQLVQFPTVPVASQFGTLQVPLAPLNPLVNLILFAVFMSLLLMAGGRLAQLGCQLLKNERIYDALLQTGQSPAQTQVDELKKL